VSTLRRLHLSNAGKRDAVVVGSGVTPPPPPTMGKAGTPATFRRFIAAADGRLDADLSAQLGDDYSAALIEGDPEIDLEVIGRFIEGTQSVLLSSTGEPVFTAPRILEISYGPDGAETGRREPVEMPATVNEEIPLRWTGRKMPIGEVVRKFAFTRSMQLQHVDGVTYDFLFAMAKELSDEGVMVLLGAGESGKDPLVMQLNGSPYRGFLEGRVDGDKYILLLHLSSMELKRPAAVSAAEEGGE
jgi:hypothetical protein